MLYVMYLKYSEQPFFRVESITRFLKKAYSVLIQDIATETSQVNTGKIKVEPMTYLDSDNLGVWGYRMSRKNYS